MTVADDRQLASVVEIVRKTLCDSIIGMYHYGSAVLGGLRPRSDIDVFVLVDRGQTPNERQQLLAQIMAVSGSRGTLISGRPIELTIARVDALAPWPDVPRREFQYGEWLRSDYEAGFVPSPEPDPDLAPLVATLLTASRPLLGPPASDLIGPVPHDQLINSMRQGIVPLLDELAEDTTNVLLTLARMAYTARFGRITSKSDAAEWAVRELPGDLRTPILLARTIYLGDANESDATHGHPRTLATARQLAAMVTETRAK